MRRHHIDVLLRSLNQDAYVVIQCLKEVSDLPVFPKDRKVIYWMDAGRHFHCQAVVSYLLLHEKTAYVKIFCGKHGKNDRDGHFGWVSKKLSKGSLEQEVKYLSEAASIIRTIKDTTAIELRLMPGSLSLDILIIEDMTSLLYFCPDVVGLRVSPYCGHASFSVPVKKKQKVISFKPKVSAKLPRPPSDTDDLSCDDSSEDATTVSSQSQTESENEHKVHLNALRRKRSRVECAVAKLQSREKKVADKMKGAKRKKCPAGKIKRGRKS